MNSIPRVIDEEVLKIIRGYVYHFCKVMPDLLRFQDQDDLVQEVAIKFIRHDHIRKFDSNITSFKYHIMRGVKTTLIDILRKEKNRRLELELDRPVGDQDGEETTFASFLPAYPENPVAAFHLEQILNMIRDQFSKEWGSEIESPLIGKTRTSAYSVFIHHIAGYSHTEIGKIFKFTGSRASQLVNEVVSWLEEIGLRKPVLSL